MKRSGIQGYFMNKQVEIQFSWISLRFIQATHGVTPYIRNKARVGWVEERNPAYLLLIAQLRRSTP